MINDNFDDDEKSSKLPPAQGYIIIMTWGHDIENFPHYWSFVRETTIGFPAPGQE